MSGEEKTRVSLRFTEEMKGYAKLGETDYQRGYNAGKESDSKIKFELTIRVDDVDAFVADPRHQTRADGEVKGDLLGGKREVKDAIFNLFVSGENPHQKRMLYRLFYLDANDNPFTWGGYKDIKDDPGVAPSEMWKDTTTLYTRILRGRVSADEEPNAEIMAAGIVIINGTDILELLKSIKLEGGTSASRAAALAKFGKLYWGTLWDIYQPQL